MAGGLSRVEEAQLGEERHLEQGEAPAGPAAWVWAPAGAEEASKHLSLQHPPLFRLKSNKYELHALGETIGEVPA